MPLAPGDRFDRYVIASLLGHGGMGEVYRAHDAKLQRSVALKILHALPVDEAGGSQPNTDGVARMMREARAAAALDHPNAVAIFDVGMAEGTSFIAMELIEGKTLRPFIGDASVPVSKRLRWLSDVARALGAAHARGLVHRDVKPENVMVRDDGVVKVLDFGIARRASGPVDATGSTAGMTFETLTGKGVLVGTPRYMAPEQMRGEQVTPGADVFAWGVLAYELLSGRSPWGEKLSALELVSQILSAEPEPIERRAAGVPEPVAAIVMQSLAKSAAARPAAMDAIVAALEPGAVSGRGAPSRSGRVSMPSGSALSGPQSSPLSSAGLASARRGRRLAWVAALAAGTVAIVGGALFAAGRHAGPAPAASALHAATPATEAADVEATSKSPDAMAAYRIALQASRDAADDVAMTELEKATAADGSFAAAHLRRAIAPMWPDSAAREHYQKAVQLRGGLGARDHALLEAFEPWERFVPDNVESERRLALAATQYPSDAEVALLSCRMRVTLGNVKGAAEACDRALQIDGALAGAWYLEALVAGIAGDVDGAGRAYSECLSRAPSASSCLRDLVSLRSNDGKCAEAVNVARSLVTAYPHAATGQVLLAQALFGDGRPIESVRLALAQAWDSFAPADRTRARLRAEAALATATGHLDAAADTLRALEKEVEKSTEEIDHFGVAEARMELALEAGKGAEAAQLATDYMKRRSAWTPAPNVDRSIYALVAEYRAGALASDAFGRLRARWWERERSGPFQSALFGASAADRWTAAYAGAALTEADAKGALAALPDGAPEPAALRRDAAWGDAVGRTYLLAGQVDRALPYLRRAAASCGALVDPLASMHATADLGAALDQTGDTAGACVAYERVLARWGSARPAPVTAERAKKRAAALGCRAE